MKTLYRTLLIAPFLAFATCLFAQDSKEAAKTLINEGIALNDSGKYEQAIDKYKQVLKLDPNSTRAQYELGYTLAASGKTKESIPYLEKTANADGYAQAYDLLASIYDDEKKYDTALEYYKQGIIAFPKFQRLRFNLAISYLRQEKYPEAEASAIEAIKLEPKHASSHRAYAMAMDGERKRANAVLGWCSFIMLEPQSKRSVAAYDQIQKDLNYGIKKTGEKSVTLTISNDELDTGNLLTQTSILTATDGKEHLTLIDSLGLRLGAVFEIAGELKENKDQPFLMHYFVDYFKNLGKTDNMPTLAHLVSLTAYRDENIKWFKENPGKLKALNDWIANTKREF